MDNECHANICVFVQNSPDPPILYKKSYAAFRNLYAFKRPNIILLSCTNHVTIVGEIKVEKKLMINCDYTFPVPIFAINIL